MADKEERILIARSSHYIISNADNETLFEGKIELPYANVITRQEAIRRIARVYGCGYKAEAALNALLEGGK